jgi:putative OPT family oligopeptide transporter
MAGLVGSSHNPVSSVTIATILFTSLLLAFLGADAISLGAGTAAGSAAGPAAAILVGSIVCTAAAIGGDTIQDLKAGALLGATPASQQIMQLVGVGAGALCLGPVLELLLGAYGFGAPTAHFPHALRAPQATLMASVAEGVFGGGLPWGFFFSGVGIGAAVLALDLWLAHKKSDFRTPVLAVALGLYLPWELTGPVLLGGAIRSWSDRTSKDGTTRGVLAAAGLITGEALMGIVLAGIVAARGSTDALTIGARLQSGWLSIAILLGTLAFLRRSTGAKTAIAK